MKILLVSYCDDGGGAAKASYNLCASFNGFNNKLLVIDKRSKNINVYLFKKGFIGKVLRRLRYLVVQIIFINQNRISQILHLHILYGQQFNMPIL